MIGLRSRILEAGSDVIGRQVRVVVEDLCLGGPSGQKRKHVGYANPGAPNGGSSMNNLRVDHNAIQARHLPRVPACCNIGEIVHALRRYQMLGGAQGPRPERASDLRWVV